jgi:hypothetical protein
MRNTAKGVARYAEPYILLTFFANSIVELNGLLASLISENKTLLPSH